MISLLNKDEHEVLRIIEKYISLGDDNSFCHVGICSIKRCNRCQDAIKIRKILQELYK